MADEVLQQAIALAQESGMNEILDGEDQGNELNENLDEMENEEPDESTPAEEDDSDEEGESSDEDSEEDSEESSDDEDDKKLVKVKIGDEEQEVTLSELKASYMRNSDYTNKTKELAKERTQAERLRAMYEENRAGYAKVLDEASKILPSLVYRESDKLTEALKKVDVGNLSQEDMNKYLQLRAYRDQVVEQEQERDRKFKELVEKQRRVEQEALDRQWATDQPAIESLIPEYRDPVKREQLNTNLSKYLIDIYGEKRAREIAQTVRSKEDYSTIYYAYIGKKYLETGTPDKVVAKKSKPLKATNQSGKQNIASAKANMSKNYDKILQRGRKRGGLTDEEAVALLTMKGI